MSESSFNGNVKAPQRGISREHSFPILWWAAVGAVIAAVIFHTFFQWVTSDTFRPSPVGPDPLPQGTLILMRALEVVLPIVMVVFYWKFLVAPWIRERRVTWDGLFLLACATIWFQDPIDNYFNFTFSYNAHFVNFASWAPYIPGWEAPRQQFFAEPVLFMGGMFMWLFFGSAVFGCWFMNTAKRKFPSMGTAGLLACLFVAFFIADLVAEVFLCRTSLFGYPGAYHELTLWAGESYQFPLYESSGIASVCVAMTLIRFYRDDKGQSFFEKGLDRLKLSSARKSLLTFFSLVAGIHILTFVTFFLPYTWFAMKADSFPKMPSYMLMGICGEGTGYACPSREVPIPSRTSLAIPPDDPRLSESAKAN